MSDQVTRINLDAAPFDVRLPKHGEPDELVDTVLQPDLALICDPAELDDRGCRGAPDWIVEILSPHTAAHDQIHKRALYERHGVHEYWLLHPTDRVLTIYQRHNQAITLRPDRSLTSTPFHLILHSQRGPASGWRCTASQRQGG